MEKKPISEQELDEWLEAVHFSSRCSDPVEEPAKAEKQEKKG